MKGAESTRLISPPLSVLYECPEPGNELCHRHQWLAPSSRLSYPAPPAEGCAVQVFRGRRAMKSSHTPGWSSYEWVALALQATYSVIKGVDRTQWDNHLYSVSFTIDFFTSILHGLKVLYSFLSVHIFYDEPIHFLSSSTPVPINVQAVSSYNNVKLFWVDVYVLFLSLVLFPFGLPLSVFKTITATICLFVYFTLLSKKENRCFCFF